MERISLHTCTVDDWEAVQKIAVETFSDTYEAHNSPEDFERYVTSAFSEKQLKTELENPHSHFLFFKKTDSILGYVKWNTNAAQTEFCTADRLEIERIYVQPAYKGKGLGRMMIDIIMHTAKIHDKSLVWLGVWEKNMAAIAFYEKMGFSKAGTHTFLFGKDEQVDFVMEKRVDQ